MDHPESLDLLQDFQGPCTEPSVDRNPRPLLQRIGFPPPLPELLLPQKECPAGDAECIHGRRKSVLLPEDQNVELPLRFGSEHTVPPYRPVVAGYESSKPFECSVEAPSAHRSLLTQGVQDVSEPMQLPMYHLPMLSILIPTFNEEQAIETTIRHVHAAFAAMADPDPFEIVVIDDGSTDRTPAILKGIALPELQIIAHPRNRGYGASMKTGIRRSRGSLIATIDADGTYPIEKFPQLLQELRLRGADMVVGAPVKKGVRIPWTRRPAKAI